MTTPIDARALLQGGDARAALETLKQQVRKSPREATLRTFLFQMFCVFGEWDRALTQLTVAAELDPLALPMAETYRTLIRCELLRDSVFAGTRTPTLFGHPEPWVPLLLEANRALAAGAYAKAAALRDQAFEQAEAMPGSADGHTLPAVTSPGCDGMTGRIACSFSYALTVLHKPIIIGEAGIAADDTPSRARRSDLLTAKMHAAFAAGASGYLVWQWNHVLDSEHYDVLPDTGDPLLPAMRRTASALTSP